MGNAIQLVGKKKPVVKEELIISSANGTESVDRCGSTFCA